MSDIEPSARPRILLVDDTALNREIIGRILEAGGYAVDLASDGEEAVEGTWSRPYDLVLMDIEMPGMNGFEAAARIRAREGVMSGVRIAALTATRQADAELFAFWSGIDTFIPKPIEPQRLLARVGELVADGGPAGDDWRPVWRLAVYAKATRWLDADETDDVLDDFSGLLDEVVGFIDTKTSATPAFGAALRALQERATRLGFEEIAGLCALLVAERPTGDARCRDPNLIGAIERARYAIDVYRREHAPAATAGWWPRTRVNVQSLFRGASRLENVGAS